MTNIVTQQAYDQMRQASVREAAQFVEECQRRREHAVQSRDEKQQSALLRRYQQASLSDLTGQTAYQRRIYRILHRYVATFPTRVEAGTSLLIQGACGTGKTHACIAVQKALREQRYDACYTTWFNFLEEIKQGYKSGERFAKQACRFIQADCLMIDEINDELFAADHKLLFEVIERRYRQCRCTIVVSNASKTHFENRLGEKIVTRLLDDGVWLSFQWASFRARLATREIHTN